ncbi:hypothetical protein ACOMHN_033132 [Nucella lapillus]
MLAGANVFVRRKTKAASLLQSEARSGRRRGPNRHPWSHDSGIHCKLPPGLWACGESHPGPVTGQEMTVVFIASFLLACGHVENPTQGQ